MAKAFGAFGGVPFALVAYLLFEDFLLAGTFADVEIPLSIAGGLLVATVAYVVLSYALPPVERDRAAL